MNKKVETLRNGYVKAMLNEQFEKIKDIEISSIEANTIVEKLLKDYQIPESHLKEMDISLSTYGKMVEFSSIPNKRVYEALIIVLTELYGNGERDRTYGDQIQYSFMKNRDDYDDRIRIYAKASTELTGCKIITEEISVPERVVPAHTETRNKIECD